MSEPIKEKSRGGGRRKERNIPEIREGGGEERKEKQSTKINEQRDEIERNKRLAKR